MKRDMKLIKTILKYVEAEHVRDQQFIELPELPCYTPDQVHYHAELCAEADYIVVTGSDVLYLQKLTWAGHEELARLRGE